MKITRQSMFSGKVHTAELPITAEEWERYERGASAQEAFPNIPPEWREFVMTGVTPAEWAGEFGKVRTGDYEGPEIEPVTLVVEEESRR